MSTVNAERAALVSLVSESLVRDPDLNENDLFWKLVEQCVETIAYVTEVDRKFEFAFSHSDSHGNEVHLLIEGVPFSIYVQEPGDGRFHVVCQEMMDDSIKTEADLLAYVKRHLDGSVPDRYEWD
jgi:hypothetical protein